MLHMKNIVFDLKSIKKVPHWSKNQCEEGTYEQWQNNIFTVDGFHPYARIQPLCGKIQWELQNSNLYRLESFSMYGIRSAYRTRKSQRFGSMPESYGAQIVSYGFQMQNSPKHNSLQQRKAGLENLCGFRPDIDSESKQALRWRGLWGGVGRNSLCPRLLHNRPATKNQKILFADFPLQIVHPETKFCYCLSRGSHILFANFSHLIMWLRSSTADFFQSSVGNFISPFQGICLFCLKGKDDIAQGSRPVRITTPTHPPCKGIINYFHGFSASNCPPPRRNFAIARLGAVVPEINLESAPPFLIHKF